MLNERPGDVTAAGSLRAEAPDFPREGFIRWISLTYLLASFLFAFRAGFGRGGRALGVAGFVSSLLLFSLCFKRL